MLRVIGLMSGTSLDGVDAAWLETDGRSVRRFGNALTLPYDEALRSDLRGILDVADGLSPDDPLLLSVTERLTDRHAEAVAEIGAAADLIGFHGQTILHRPNQGRTWQVGDAVRLARRTGLPVAHDFRSADMAAGGEGAPLAPVFHQALARDLDLPLAVLNIGGVANVTWVGPHGQLLAWDTGPGNGPLDDWVFRHTGAACDWNGAIAARGKADREIVAALLEAPYFRAVSAEVAGPAGFCHGPGQQRTVRVTPGGRGRNPCRLHCRRSRSDPPTRTAETLADLRWRTAESGDHAGAGRCAARPRRARRDGRLER